LWSLEDVETFATRASGQELQRVTLTLAAAGDAQALGVLKLFLAVPGGSTYEKRLPAVLAARALLQAGPPGVAVLADALVRGPRPRYASALLMMLWKAAREDFTADALLEGFGPSVEDLDPPAGTDEAARRALSDYAAELLVRPQRLTDVGTWLQTLAVTAPAATSPAQAAAEFVSFLGEASIRLAPTLLDEYAAMIADQHDEETYQQFLTTHPALLDPLASTVLPKLRLGTEYATDFAVRRHDDRWLLVEIEKPQDRIFTARDDFSAKFTHAYGQVLDFQRWVDDNLAYARNTMSEIFAPQGLLVMGRRAEMTDRQQKKLAQMVSNSARVDVMTFDDLLKQARVVYENLHGRR
jgi:hypothetical protein